MARLTKAEAKKHHEAEQLLDKDTWTHADREFFTQHWQESANHVNTTAGAFFTPLDYAMDVALDVGPGKIVDLCAGIGTLSYAAMLRNGTENVHITCIELNPAYVEIGRKMIPQARWITGDTARRQVHELRANVGRAGGAILVGGNTLHTDNPLLTARLDDPVERQPLAVSISSRVPAPDSLLLFKERPTETIFFTTASGAATPRAAQLRERGVRIRGLDRWKSGEDLVQILEYLRQEAGCPYVLCEGGGRLGLSLLEAGLVDEFHLHIAPKVLGDNDARPLFDGRTPLELDEALSLRLVRMEPCGEDGHLIFRPVRACSQA